MNRKIEGPLIKLKRLLYLLLILTSCGAIAMYYSNKKVKRAAKNKCFTKTEDITFNKTGLLLGTSQYLANGNDNLYFKYRIEAAIELFKANKIARIIISGDNSVAGYDEPSDMRKELIKSGIDSSLIYLDYAGFRTFDSMVRAKEVFGQDSLTIISQRFHNERAIYIAERIGIYAIGFNAEDVNKVYGFKTNMREYFARVKVIVDFLIGTQPKFLGDKVEVL